MDNPGWIPPRREASVGERGVGSSAVKLAQIDGGLLGQRCVRGWVGVVTGIERQDRVARSERRQDEQEESQHRIIVSRFSGPTPARPPPDPIPRDGGEVEGRYLVKLLAGVAPSQVNPAAATSVTSVAYVPLEARLSRKVTVPEASVSAAPVPAS